MIRVLDTYEALFYHPQANGGVECFNATSKNRIRAHQAQSCVFEEALNQTLPHYRVSHHSTTLVSTTFLMFGRDLELPLHRLRAPHGDFPTPTGHNDTTRWPPSGPNPDRSGAFLAPPLFCSTTDHGGMPVG
ncbi:Integrase core domain [Solea senegalensis]|uniref:Integrase core domain n=1 Tax=Solea senegalensis TaxID=28829 RepID=A0AAV6S6L4_SOLSE|nr:Integrase core domain [Solea senegalensis]